MFKIKSLFGSNSMSKTTTVLRNCHDCVLVGRKYYAYRDTASSVAGVTCDELRTLE